MKRAITLGASLSGWPEAAPTSGTGAQAVQGKVHFRDLHATILHALGLPANDLKFWHEGRDHRLTGPEGGEVVEALFA